jgi:ABC-type nitrate/sulfonate/bicarbonate transport system ATPase subunit
MQMTTPSKTTIACRNLGFKYDQADAPVFSQLSFSIPLSGFHALFGPSGVGKTTLAAVLSGAAAPSEGTVGMDPAAIRMYTYNSERLPGWSSVGRHLEKVCQPAHRDMLQMFTEVFGISACLDKRFPQLSLGQKNRVNLIRYLVQDFHLLLMDESLANVDEQTRERIILCIKDTFPNRGFVYISHNILEVARFCSQIVVVRGAGKSPAARTVAGLDITDGDPRQRVDQDRVMLEVMNAV